MGPNYTVKLLSFRLQFCNLKGCTRQVEKTFQLQRFVWRKMKQEAQLNYKVLSAEVDKVTNLVQARVEEYAKSLTVDQDQGCAGCTHLKALQIQYEGQWTII